MSDVTCSEIRIKKPGETRNILLAFDRSLDKDDSIDETISSITSVTVTGPTISNTAITSTARALRDNTGKLIRHVPAGKAITFTVAGGTDGTDYTIIAKVVTSGSQTIERNMTLQVRAT